MVGGGQVWCRGEDRLALDDLVHDALELGLWQGHARVAVRNEVDVVLASKLPELRGRGSGIWGSLGVKGDLANGHGDLGCVLDALQLLEREV